MGFTLVVRITDCGYFALLTCERELIRGVAEAVSRSLEHHHLLLAPLGVLYLTPPQDFNPIHTQSIHPKIHNPSEYECCSTRPHPTQRFQYHTQCIQHHSATSILDAVFFSFIFTVVMFYWCSLRGTTIKPTYYSKWKKSENLPFITFDKKI